MSVSAFSSISSLTAVTVTVCALFQLPVVKVKLLAEKLTSLPAAAKATVTEAVGWVSRTTVKVSVVEPSVTSVLAPPTSVTVIPAVSLSVMLTVTLLIEKIAESLSYLGSVLLALSACVIVAVAGSSILSSKAFTVMVCGVFQLAAVNSKVSSSGVSLASAILSCTVS